MFKTYTDHPRLKVTKILVFPLILLVVCLGMTRIALSDSGDILWQDELRGMDNAAVASVAVQGGQVFVGGTVMDGGVVRSYDSKNGTGLWEDIFNPGSGNTEVVGTVVRGSRLYIAGVMSRDNDIFWNVRAYEAKAGGLLWQDVFNLNSLPASANAVAEKGQRVFVAGAVVPEEGRSDWFVMT